MLLEPCMQSERVVESLRLQHGQRMTCGSSSAAHVAASSSSTLSAACWVELAAVVISSLQAYGACPDCVTSARLLSDMSLLSLNQAGWVSCSRFIRVNLSPCP